MTDLTDIKQRKAWYSQGGDAIRVVLSPSERDALCDALRIAVAAPAGLCCPECGWMWGESRDEYNGCEQCDENAAALAAVRELVDLGEKP